MKIFVAAAVLALISATPVWAAELDGCSLTNKDFKKTLAPALHGDFKAINGRGTMVLTRGDLSLTEPLPAKGGETVQMRYEDGMLSAGLERTGRAEVRTVRGKPSNYGVAFEFNAQGKAGPREVMDPKAMGGMPPCGPTEMARIQFGGTLTDSEGASRTYHFTLHVVNEDLMSGVMQMDGNQEGNTVEMRRLVTLKRK